jgi:hypothetical protein
MPFRPYPKTPKGKTKWREIKVGLFARAGKQVTRLCHGRLIAILGDVDAFTPLMKLEAHLQSWETAPQVIWLSDGGQGF